MTSGVFNGQLDSHFSSISDLSVAAHALSMSANGVSTALVGFKAW
jgi:hypothetical protein